MKASELARLPLSDARGEDDEVVALDVETQLVDHVSGTVERSLRENNERELLAAVAGEALVLADTPPGELASSRRTTSRARWPKSSLTRLKWSMSSSANESARPWRSLRTIPRPRNSSR